MGLVEAAFVGAGIGVVAIWIWWNASYLFRRRAKAMPRLDVPLPMPDTTAPEIDREFRSVFSLMPEARRRDLIDGIMKRKGCSRAAAMRFAIDDRARDETRWD
ncbi:hypothetical protein [Agrobacterium larrymoorei]|uniref:Uncharacterized protein n=1 Tax=Agrobacterium larrymoorei TaxID=160699 RepID=A0ABX8TFB1_9HYPH|nr:hypothetical protein [Agrobacterium larrymoorei]QYA10838.1 hypothetical protein J5285_25775 [Agrobacterium larrymoorei]